MNTSLKIFCACYRPFLCGGNCDSFISTTITKYKIVALGKGFQGALFQNPQTKKFYIAELTSGGVCGSGNTEKAVIKMIRDDTRSGTKDETRTSIVKALKNRQIAIPVTNDEFFKNDIG